MTLKEAIEIKAILLKGDEAVRNDELIKADRLLLEAGKLIIQHPTIRFFLEEKLLPGETEE